MSEHCPGYGELEGIPVVPKASREAVEAKLAGANERVEVDQRALVGLGKVLDRTHTRAEQAETKLAEAERKLAAPKATSKSMLRMLAHTRGVCPICSQLMDIDPKLPKAVEALREIERAILAAANGDSGFGLTVDEEDNTGFDLDADFLTYVGVISARVLSELEAKDD